MGRKLESERQPPERPARMESRVIDVADGEAMRFWSERLGVSPDEIIEAVKEVGPNATAVLLKLDAPQRDTIAPPTMTPRS